MSTGPKPVPSVAYIGCWFRRDMYAHNCSAIVDSLRACGIETTVVTSNCRCFSSAQQFDIAVEELINPNCVPVMLPHAPHNPGKRYGSLKSLIVRIFWLDIWLSTVRGVLYYRKSRHADIAHYDQVLEAFGAVPLFVLAMLAGVRGRRLFVTVHEIDPLQQAHRWINRMYSRCERVIVFSENMKRAVEALGVESRRIVVTRYGSVIPALVSRERSQYIYFGGHNILTGKGYLSLLEALRILKSRGLMIRLMVYVGYGCNGLEEAQAEANQFSVADMIQWNEFFTSSELAAAYQSCKACIIPFTSGSARHPLTTAMANATPVIATRNIDIPEYLGSFGIYIDGSAESIADSIEDVEAGRMNLVEIGDALRKRATEELDVQHVAKDMREVFLAGHP
jgi:glycosyltransferase involved in cell wall biosynthesis